MNSAERAGLTTRVQVVHNDSLDSAESFSDYNEEEIFDPESDGLELMMDDKELELAIFG